MERQCVITGQKEAVKIADIRIGEYRLLIPLYPHLAPQGRSLHPIRHEASDAPVYRTEIRRHGTLIVLPVAGQLARRRALRGRQLDSYLQTAQVTVVPVLHAALNAVPRGTVRNPIRKKHAVRHLWIQAGVCTREELEELVIGWAGIAAGG